MYKLFVLFFLGYYTNSFCQVETQIQKDSLIVISEYEYDLNFGISMFHRFCPSQKTHNKNGKLLREIKYENSDDSKSNIKEIIYHYYNDYNQLISKEYYSINASLLFLIVYEYDNDTRDTLRIKKGIIQSNKLVASEDIKFKYKNGIISTITRYNKNKKAISKTSILTSQNKQIKKEIFTKHSLKTDSIVSRETTLKYKNEQHISEKIIIQYRQSTSDTIKYSFSYNEENLLSNVSLFINDSVENKKELSYYPEGELKSISLFNSDNKKVRFYAFEINKLIRPFGGIESSYLKLIK